MTSNRLHNKTNDWRLNKCIYFCDILLLYINLKPTPYCKFRGTIPKSIQKAVFIRLTDTESKFYLFDTDETRF